MSQPNQPKVVTVTCSGSDCTVSPGALTMSIHQDVTFCNNTSAGIAVMMSDERMFSEHQFKVDSGDEVTKRLEDIDDGDYPYAVYCDVINDFAHASSMPKIVVRRQL